MPGALALLTAKLAGLGTAAKAVIAAITAAVTMTLAGGATGVLPLPGSHTDAAAVSQAAVQRATAAAGAITSAAPATTTAGSGSAVGTSTHASASTSTASAATTAKAATTASGASAAAVVPTVGKTANAAANVVNLPGAATGTLPTLPACVTALIPTAGTRPDLAKLFADLPACILSVIKAHLPLDGVRGAMGSAHLPADVARCLSAALEAAPATAGAGAPGLRHLLSGCVPAGLPGTGTGTVKGTGSIPGLGSFAGLKTGR